MKKIAILIGLTVCTSTFSASSQDLLWNDVIQTPTVQKRIKPTGAPKIKRRALSLNENGLKTRLAGTNVSLKKDIDLPLPNGQFVRVRAIESQLLSAELAVRHPDIKTWRVVGVDDPAISGRIDFTSSGFHGMLVLADGETIFIDPDKDKTTNLYHSLSKRENASLFNNNFSCSTHKNSPVFTDKVTSNPLQSKLVTKQGPSYKLANLPASQLITYRLAVAGTGEYTAALGGRVSAYNSLVTTINRVNQVYQTDLGVKLQLVSDETLLYTNAATDPYTDNSRQLLVEENMANLSTVLGVANYDIGHVFARGISGGLAYVGVACLDKATVSVGQNQVSVSDIKAGGTSGSNLLTGDLFSINIVAHEIGHQLGANHTFNGVNGSCASDLNDTKPTNTKVEPGGGSTIMSYSGNCGSDSYQANPDAMFHWKSISQINDYTRVNTIGSSCGLRTPTGNQAPIANAGANHVIPVNTPFLLDGVAVAAGASYTWDQVDAGMRSAVDVDTGDNAIIRSLYPTSNPDRYIPRLTDLFSGGKTKGEMLPQTVRNLNFSFVVRDGNGGIGNDLKLISTVDTGAPFQVISHSFNQILIPGKSTHVMWDVASTTNAPINCANVDIQLLRANGVKNTLLMGTANDGSQTVIVPISTPSLSNARIMVACSTQPFFQISAGSITVLQGGVDTTPPVITIMGASTVDVAKGSSYKDSGATALDNFDGLINVTKTSTVNTAVLGQYSVTYFAKDNAGNKSKKVRTVNVVQTIANTSAAGASGGSLSFGLLPLILIGLRKRIVKLST